MKYPSGVAYWQLISRIEKALRYYKGDWQTIEAAVLYALHRYRLETERKEEV